MLIEFSVENFRSIKDEARLSLVAGPGKEHRETHLVTPELNEGVRSVTLVRSAAIYGANAAGKTNLVQALQAMRHIVLRSGHDIGDLPVAPFLFDPEVGTQPTTFEVVGIANRTRFQYGFSTRRGVVTDEWLYAWPKGRIQFWFERNTGRRNRRGQVQVRRQARRGQGGLATCDASERTAAFHGHHAEQPAVDADFRLVPQ